MTALLERPTTRHGRSSAPRPTAPAPAQVRAHVPAAVPRVTVIGDFNCPWSYLAFRRAAILAVAGVDVEWLAVEHAPWTPSRNDDRSARIVALQQEMPRVVDLLLPGEPLPYDLAGFVPSTRPAVAAYAEACVAGVGEVAKRVIFESFWMHGIDIGDPRVLRILMIDELRNGQRASEPVREWGYPVDVTGAPISSDAWRLVRDWSQQWRRMPQPVVPALRVVGAEPVVGVEAVEWLGEEIRVRGLELDLPPAPTQQQQSTCRELPALGWVTENGGRWLRRRQRRPVSPYHRAG